MNTIKIRALGFAAGATFSILYLACVLVMTIAGRETSVLFFNSLFHGIDFNPVIRMNVPFVEAVIGVIEVFILGWLSGATIACFYNLAAGIKSKK